MINECTPGVADDFYIVNLLIRLIIHFELRNYEMAEDLSKKVKIPIKKYNFFIPLHDLLLINLKDAVLAKTPKKHLQHMQEPVRELEKLGPKFENIIKLKIYFNFKDWVKAKASGKEFNTGL